MHSMTSRDVYIESGIIKDVMKQLVQELKSIIMRVYPAMEEADVIAVLCVIPD